MNERQRIYLIRHGEIEGAAEGRLIGRTDVALSARGHEQAQKLADAMAGIQFTAIYSSNLQRARTTAEPIATRKGLTLVQDDAWRELNVGDWDGRTMKEINDESPELVAQLFADPTSFQYPGGESFPSFIVRIQQALTDLLAAHAHDDIALVTHGGVCRTIIGTILGMPPSNWLRLSQDYCCVNLIDWYDGNPSLRYLNSLTPIQM